MDIRSHFRVAVETMWRPLLDSIMPPACVLCGDSTRGETLCESCQVQISGSWPKNAVACRFCGLPRPGEAALPFDQRCQGCKGKDFHFDEVVALAIYQEAVREAVVASKLARHAPLAAALGEQLAKRLIGAIQDGGTPDRVTYVPTHFTRRFQRRSTGSVAAMATVVGQRLERPTESLLHLTRRVKKQSLLPDSQRPANVRGAFAVKRRYLRSAHSLRDQHILLIDDVLTTGSTASEVSMVLKQSGAAKVTLAVIARAVRR